MKQITIDSYPIRAHLLVDIQPGELTSFDQIPMGAIRFVGKKDGMLRPVHFTLEKFEEVKNKNLSNQYASSIVAEKLIRQKIPVYDIPAIVYIEETPYEERQAIAKEIDNQKRKDNPEFKGAFHEKKHEKKQDKKDDKNKKRKPGLRGGKPKGGRGFRK